MLKTLLAGCVLFTSLLTGNQTAQAEQQWIYIASPAKPAVIYRCSLDLETGQFGELEIAAGDVRTGFMDLHPTKPILYAGTSEAVEKGQPNGFVRAYRINKKDGSLKQFSTATTADSGTTHIEVSAQGKVALVCHYGGEGTSAIPVGSQGRLINTVSKIKHEGSSADPRRQKKPHPHGVAIHQSGKFVCVADLGNDHVEVFRISKQGKLSKCSFWKAAPGAGPRHVSFHPNGKWLYCINELDNTLVLLDFDDEN
ncbi:MAG: beta-propeller fold lactonase family protein, partial [Planctomycetaceae bacterium]|nr:beta-propeller fold lactonase family protein [Planctomycetaceae bacterium]